MHLRPTQTTFETSAHRGGLPGDTRITSGEDNGAALVVGSELLDRLLRYEAAHRNRDLGKALTRFRELQGCRRRGIDS